VVLDCAAGMSNQGQWVPVRQAVVDFLAVLHDKGYGLGIVPFNEQALAYEPERRPLQKLVEYVMELTACGRSDVGAGIAVASSELRSKDGKRLMVVITDGKGLDPIGGLRAAQSVKAMGIDFFAFGTADRGLDFLTGLSSGVWRRGSRLPRSVATLGDLAELLPTGCWTYLGH
jgi:Mg-chelatase subunit ChlD